MNELLKKAVRSPATGVAAAFVLSRLVYRIILGVRFDSSPVDYFIQFLDPHYLKTDLLRSVLSLHHQAPLLNFFVGACLKLFGGGAFVVVDMVFLALGLMAAQAMLAVLLGLGVSPRIAVVGVSLFVCSPVVVLYESWLFYPHVVASLLVLASWLLVRFLEHESLPRGAAFFCAIATVGLIRSTYGVVWFLAALGVILALRPSAHRTLFRCAALPLLVLGLVPVKTKLHVGHGYGDAMLWPNLARKISLQLPPGELRRLTESRLLSPAMNHEAFADLGTLKELRVPHRPTGTPALDDERSPSQRPNANALEYVLIAERFSKPDALYLLRHYPAAYAQSVLLSLTLGVPSSPTHDLTLPRSPNYQRLKFLDDALKTAGLAQSDGFSPVIAVLLLFGLGTGVHLLRARRGQAGRSSSRGFVAFAVITIFYTIAATALISWGDFGRYRYEVDGLFWILIVLGAQGVLAKIRYPVSSTPRAGEAGKGNAAPHRSA